MSEHTVLCTHDGEYQNKLSTWVTVPRVQDGACETAEIFKDGRRVLQLQKLFLFVLEESQGEAEYDLWGKKNDQRREICLTYRTAHIIHLTCEATLPD